MLSVAAMCVCNPDRVRPLGSIADRQPQLQPALLRLWAMISQYFTAGKIHKKNSLREILTGFFLFSKRFVLCKKRSYLAKSADRRGKRQSRSPSDEKEIRVSISLLQSARFDRASKTIWTATFQNPGFTRHSGLRCRTPCDPGKNLLPSASSDFFGNEDRETKLEPSGRCANETPACFAWSD